MTSGISGRPAWSPTSSSRPRRPSCSLGSSRGAPTAAPAGTTSMWDGTVLDGELIAGRFAGTMAALHGSRRFRDDLRFVVFDVPYLAGADLRRLSWEERRERLELLAQ